MMNKKNSKPVTLILGNDWIIIQDAIDQVLEANHIDRRDNFDIVEYDGKDISKDEIIESSFTAPFIAHKRTVIVRRADQLSSDDSNRIANELPKLPKTTLLILQCELPENPRDVRASVKHLEAAVKQVGEIIRAEATPTAVMKRLEVVAQELGTKIERQAASLLCEMTASNMANALAELEKCALYVGKGGTITPTIIKTVAIPSRDYRVFQLLDAICASNRGLALQEFEPLVETSKRIEDAAIQRLLPLLHRQIRLLYQARSASDEGLRPGDQRLRQVCPNLHSWIEASNNDFVNRKVQLFASKLPINKISQMSKVLAETEMRLKGQLPSANPRESLERMIFEMCDIVQS